MSDHWPAVPGLVRRGAFHPTAADAVPALVNGARAGTLVLFGFAGREGWPAFAAAPEAQDGLADPLDRWSRRVIGALAEAVGGTALFPFGGPPFLPFQRWARRGEMLFPSPLGLLIHPVFGLWHSYRGAVAVAGRLPIPPMRITAHPCATCADRPCLPSCPVGAFTEGGYDVPRCAGYLATPAGADCMRHGCAARRACPVGAEHRMSDAAATFHMRAFLAARA